MKEPFEFTVYKYYLIHLAKRSGRPFSLPKTYDVLEKRQDYKLIMFLTDHLTKKGIIEPEELNKFFDSADEFLCDFYVADMLKNFNDIIKIYNTKKNDRPDIILKIKNSFNFLKEYCLLNKVSDINDLCEGSPPIILKLWKTKKISEEILVVLFDFDRIKKKTWYKIYCGDLERNINTIRRDNRLVEFMRNELVSFKNELNSI